MDSNKILSADLLDIIFDNKNKDYGAYALRKTYQRRITKALLLTTGVVVVTITSFAFGKKANPGKLDNDNRIVIVTTTIDDPIEPPPPKPVQPPPQPVQTRTAQLTKYVIAPPDENPDPPPTQDDLKNAQVGLQSNPGTDYTGVQTPTTPIADNNGVMETQKKVDEGPTEFFEIAAQFKGNWEKFLLRNLRPDVPSENGAPAGRYTVVVQFVVSLDGSVSDIKALTSIGYGLEKEAIRVLNKAEKWEPAIQNGHPVKSYRKQPITFIVEE